MSDSHIIFDTQAQAMVDWPQNDVISWVEWRVRSFEVSRENEKKGFGSEPPDHPLSELDLKIWLANQRDEETQSNIARRLYGREWKSGKGKRDNQGLISRVRRSIERVEKFLNRGQPDFAYSKKWRDQLNNDLNNFIFR